MASPVSIEKEDRREEELTSSEEEDLPESMEESDGDTCPANELQPVYGSLASSKPMSKSDQTVPLKEYEELRFKLKILESKRHEDRERFREHEKIKEEAEQFLTLRNKLQDKISELQKDVREARRELKETSQEKETVETKYVDLLESMEMLTLDKEVAEEKAESLQQETNILKDRMEEISVDLDVLKKEADRMNRPPEERGAHEDERTPLEVIQLERHNERLKDALLRLRDAANDSEAELNLKIKILEQESHELEEIQYQNEKLREQLDSAELLVEDLKVQLDDAVGTEDLVEQLTEKNLNLTERMEELRASVDDLEALKELADELEENHMETEKQLQAEIDHRDMLLREQVERLKANEETMTDYETTIEQFRELVNHLQDDLKELKRKEKADQTEKMSLSSQSQAMMSLNLQLQTTVMKAQAKSIDIELRKLEANQANDRLNMIQPYLPEAFLKTESDSISCLLLFKRLEFKSELVIRHLDQNHPVSEKIMDNVTENLVSMCEIKQRAGWLSSLSTRFQTHIKNCDPEAFAKLGRVYLDLTGVERRMNSIVELFRTDQINAPYCLNELQRIISQVEHLVENVPAQEKNNSDQFFGLTKALDLNADRMIVIFTFCRQMLSNAIRNDELTLLEGVGEMEQDYMEPLGRLITQAKNSKIITKKLIRQLEDKLEEAMTLKGEHMHRFKTLYSISTKLCQFCYEIYRDLVLYVNNKKGSHEPVELCHIKKLLQDKGDDIFELTESSMWESSMRALRSLTNELETTTLQIEGDDKLDKIMVKVAPWIQRASDIKAEVVVNRELEYKLQQYNEEIVRLVKDGKLKEQTLQESEVKINLLEKRMVVARKEIEHVKALEEDLEKSLNQERLLENAMETLENENDALENEISQLKKEASKKEEKRQSLIRKATFDLAEQEDTSTMQEMAGNYYAMSNQMETLRTSVRYLRAENAHLKSLDFARSLDLALDPISAVENVPDDRSKSLARETRVLIKDLRVAGASPRIIPLSTPQPHSMQPSVLYTLQQRSTLLRNQISALHHVQNKESSRTLQTLALVKIPNLIQNAASKHAIHLKSVTEFKQLHSLFMPA
ncbi:dynein associated protein-domain-containing protein [Sporodiniella umbellata]|nr:dynein associated protein-domain-containing protein [Sporodiniella umbellata]